MSQVETSRRKEVALAAAQIIENTQDTHYQHNPVIDPKTGTYRLDCSEFVSYVLRGIAPHHYARIPKEYDRPCPRAFEYFDYLHSLIFDKARGWQRNFELDGALVFEAAPGWARIAPLADARPGDVIAWRLPRLNAGEDTGHVAFIAEKPRPIETGITSVRVYDSSRLPHFDDSRMHDGVFQSGVGIGTLVFQVSRSGEATAVKFSPDERFHSLPIAIGRLEPFTS